MASSMRVSDMSGMETRELLVRSTVLLVPIFETSFRRSFFFFALVLAYIFFISLIPYARVPLYTRMIQTTMRIRKSYESTSYVGTWRLCGDPGSIPNFRCSYCFDWQFLFNRRLLFSLIHSRISISLFSYRLTFLALCKITATTSSSVAVGTPHSQFTIQPSRPSLQH